MGNNGKSDNERGVSLPVTKKSLTIPITKPKRLDCSISVIGDRAGFYDPKRLFFAHFQTLACIKSIWWLSLSLVEDWINFKFIPQNKLLNSFFHESYGHTKKEMYFRDKIWIFAGGLLIDLDDNGVLQVFYQPGLEKTAQMIIDTCKGFTDEEKKNTTVGIIVRGSTGLELVWLNNKNPELNLNTNYNDDLLPFHQKILKKIQPDNCSGLVLLYGQPGCGKSTYLRYLISLLNKTCIFLPAHLALSLDSPELTYVLVTNPGSVLIIEDAEQLLVSRDTTNSSSISMLLNLTDGILGESLGITVLASFNKNIACIDPALCRKGRLLCSYEFTTLSVEKSVALVKQLGYTNYPSIDGPMTLADIYNMTEETSPINTNSRNRIGFKENE